MKNIQKSNKILGLEKLILAGANVPDYGIIPDFSTLEIDYCALNPKHRIKILQDIINDNLNKIGISEYGYSLRSASFDEDISSSSAAGRYISFNALKTPDELYLAAIIIWKHHRNNSIQEVLCPLIIQKTHCSYFSGVYFKDNSNDKSICVIESYYGSCKSIVEGMVLPYKSTFIDNKWSHDFSSEKNNCYKFYAHKGLFKNKPELITDGTLLINKQDPFPEQVRNYIESDKSEIIVYGYRPSNPPVWYKENICEQLNSISINLDDGNGVDIEWGTGSDGNLVFYQYRPLTRSIYLIPDKTKELLHEFPNKKGVQQFYTGIPASPGTISGIITYQNSTPGEHSILMLNEARVDDLQLVEKSVGVISSLGGMLSHLAIVCRELKKPCIVGIQNVIPENTLVEINGSTGIIKILDKHN
ncbi:MAG: PEP-utilizing enzyme [Cyanobacteriota bacterium]